MNEHEPSGGAETSGHEPDEHEASEHEAAIGGAEHGGRLDRAAGSHEPPRSRLFLPALIGGWVLIWYGATRALDNRRDSNPTALVQHVIAFDLVHDLVIAPVVVLVGWLLGRVLPPVARGPVRAAAALTAIIVVFAYPLFRRWGVRPTNSSTLPLPYARNIVIVVAAVWLVAVATIAWRNRRAPSADV